MLPAKDHQEDDGSDDDVPLAIRKKRPAPEDDNLLRSKRKDKKIKRFGSVFIENESESVEILLPDEVTKYRLLHILSTTGGDALFQCSG